MVEEFMRIVAQSRNADFRNAIMFCCDKKYLPFALFAARQISSLPASDNFDICIVSLEHVEVPADLLDLNLRVCHIDTEGAFSEQDIHGNLGEATFLRLAIPGLFVEDYDRVLYLDSDIFVDGGDFGALLQVDLGDHCLAAVRDQKQWRDRNFVSEEFGKLEWPPCPYFNAGVMLIDLKKFIDLQIMEKCIEFGKKYGDKLDFHDQSLLNCVLRGQWAELSPTWNWQWSLRRPFFEQVVGPNISHFITQGKPWLDQKGSLPARYRKAYKQFFARYYPDENVFVEETFVRLRDPKRLFLLHLKHIATINKILRYIDGFSDDLDVKI